MLTMTTKKPKEQKFTRKKMSNSVEKIKVKKKGDVLDMKLRKNWMCLTKHTVQNKKKKIQVPKIEKKEIKAGSAKNKKVYLMKTHRIAKQFEEITKIYQQSKSANNEEEISLYCLNESLDDIRTTRIKSATLQPLFFRNSQKSVSLLPSIEERESSESEQELRKIEYTEQVIKRSKNIQFSTTTSTRFKNIRSLNDNYVTEFQLRVRGKSNEKKLVIDVQNLLKSRSKAKSSMSNRSAKRSARD